MSKAIHLICAKCGSDSCYITTEILEHDEIEDGYRAEAYIHCNNCSELTSHGEHNGWITDVDKKYFSDYSLKEINEDYKKVKIIK